MQHVALTLTDLPGFLPLEGTSYRSQLEYQAGMEYPLPLAVFQSLS